MLRINIPQSPPQIFNVRAVWPYSTSNFPSGECYVKLDTKHTEQAIRDGVEILFRYDGDASIIRLISITYALKALGVDHIDLIIPYFPGARSDRLEEEQAGECLSVKMYADLINAQGYRKVTIFDAHSNVAPALINNVQAITNKTFVKDAYVGITRLSFVETNRLIFVSPDLGASKKVRKISEMIGHPMIQAEKARDILTGKLIPGKCVIHGDVKDKDVIIVDDICSRGGTFIALAKELKAQGARFIFLVVSHFEDTAEVGILERAGISKIFTTDSQLIIPRDDKVIYPIEKYVS